MPTFKQFSAQMQSLLASLSTSSFRRCQALWLSTPPMLKPLLTGCLYGLAFVPHILAPLFVMALVRLYHQIDGARNLWHAIRITLGFAIGFICTSMYWVGYAFTTVQMGYIGPVAVLGLAALLAGFQLPLPYLVRLAPKGVARRWAFIAAFWVCEWLRGHLFTGLPWNFAGHTWGIWALGETLGGAPHLGLVLQQCTAYIGIYGLSFLTIAMAVWAPTKRGWMGALTALLALGVFGQLRLNHNPTRTYETPVYMRMVQPSIDPNEKWNHNQLEDILLLQMNLSRLQSQHKLAAIIWPEAAVPLTINQEPYLRQGLATIVPHEGVLITGSVLREPADMNATGSVSRKPEDMNATGNVAREPAEVDSAAGSNPTHVKSTEINTPSQTAPHDKRYSALVALDETGTLVAAHRKAHLLPFGEYAPFRKWLPIEKFTPGSVDYSEGPGIKTTHVKGLPPFAPLLCFEAVFSGEVTERAAHSKADKKILAHTEENINSAKPAWLLNLTNDAWYQDSIGLKQHLAHVRLRAIEEGLPMVRSANNGISAVIDGAGRILKQLKANQIGVLDFELPRPLYPSYFKR